MSEHSKPLTGKSVLMIFGGAFAAIIAANMALVYSAVGTFPGLETRKPYIESLNFNEARAAQEALDWSTSVAYANGRVLLRIVDANGVTPRLEEISFRIGRATTAQQDETVTPYFDGKTYAVQKELEPGNWQVKISAQAGDGTAFRRSLPLVIRGAS